jgi:hypothetical protein
MAQSIVPSAHTTSEDIDTNIIRDIMAQCRSFIGTPASNAPEESKYHFVNINYVVGKWKFMQREDQIYTPRDEPKVSSHWINSC